MQQRHLREMTLYSPGVRINNSPDEYRMSDTESPTALFYALLISEYGGDASAYWDAAF